MKRRRIPYNGPPLKAAPRPRWTKAAARAAMVDVAIKLEQVLRETSYARRGETSHAELLGCMRAAAAAAAVELRYGPARGIEDVALHRRHMDRLLSHDAGGES